MKVEKFKVLLYLKKSGLDKNGKAPIMGRITLNRTMAQFGCKLSCTPKLWNPRESRLDGKSKEAVEVNAKIDKLLLAINSAYESLVERKTDFDAKVIKDLFQCSADTQMTLLKQLDAIIADIESRIGIDYKKGTLPNYQYTRLTLGLFVKKRYGTDDVAFGELDELFIREYMDFCLDERGLALDTVRHYLAILKKTCRIAFKAGHSERYHFMHFKLPQKKENPPKALTREDFLKIRDLEIPERRKSLALTRDLFLFACYTGTAYADTVSITEENLFRDEEGSLWLKYHRKKNKMLARVKLLPEALAMLEKYKDPTRPTLLPPQEFRVLRGNMKSLRELLGNPKGTKSFSSWSEFTDFVNEMPIKTIQPFVSNFKAFAGEGFYGNVVQGLVIKQLEDAVFIFGIAIDGTLIFRKRNYPDVSTWEDPKIIIHSNN